MHFAHHSVQDMQESTCDDSSFFHDMVQMSVHVTGKETGCVSWIVVGRDVGMCDDLRLCLVLRVIKTEDQRPYENNFDHTFW